MKLSSLFSNVSPAKLQGASRKFATLSEIFAQLATIADVLVAIADAKSQAKEVK